VPATNAKANNSRVVPLNSDALAVLTQWIEHPLRLRLQLPGSRPDQAALRKGVAAECNASMLSGFRFNDLRHTWARGLGLATATTSAAFFPHLEQRIRDASSLSVTFQPIRRAGAWSGISRPAPHSHTTRTRKSPKHQGRVGPCV
jgi:hypothetical protein